MSAPNRGLLTHPPAKAIPISTTGFRFEADMNAIANFTVPDKTEAALADIEYGLVPTVPATHPVKPSKPLFDFKTLPRCGAHARSTGKPCQRAGSLRNGRCKLHGGRSTGAKTSKGRRKARNAGLKHGRESAVARTLKRYLSACVKLEKADQVLDRISLGLGGVRYVPVLVLDADQHEAAIERVIGLGEALARERRKR